MPSPDITTCTKLTTSHITKTYHNLQKEPHDPRTHLKGVHKYIQVGLSRLCQNLRSRYALFYVFCHCSATLNAFFWICSDFFYLISAEFSLIQTPHSNFSSSWVYSCSWSLFLPPSSSLEMGTSVTVEQDCGPPYKDKAMNSSRPLPDTFFKK